MNKLLQRALVPALVWLLLAVPAMAAPSAPQPAPSAPQPAPSASAASTARPPGPTGGQFKLGSEEGVGFGTLVPDPTALYGPSRLPVVLPGNSSLSTVSVPFYAAVKTGADQRLLLEGEGDYTQFGADVSYSIRPRTSPGIYTANAFLMRGRLQAFEEGNVSVGLLSPVGRDPWIYQVGGGLEYAFPLSARLQLAAALSYRQVSTHSGAFTGVVPPFDQQGNPLTIDPDGVDEIPSARVVGLYSTLDDLQFPTRGTKLRFGFEQTVPVGGAQIRSTRAMANFTQFVPIDGFGFGKGPRTFIFNLQAGGMFGDVPAYDAFNLGGVNSVRGWTAGQLGTGQSFFEATAEYRFPIAETKLLGQDAHLRGALFVDYATDLGSAGGVHGRPALVRQKSGEGAGVGAGLHLVSPVGLVRLEAGVSNLGRTSVYFTIGDRY